MLRRTASAYGVGRSRVVTFPTAIIISLHDRVEERVTLTEGSGHTLRLDQIADVYELGEAAQRGAVAPGEGLARLVEILRKSARFGVAGTVVGHMILSVGLSMVLVPSLTSVAVAAVLGAIVGALRAFNRNQPVLAMPLPVVAAGAVSVLVFLAVKRGLPAMVTFLPSFWLLVPGALGLLSLKHMLSDPAPGVEGLIAALFALVSIALGTLRDAALYKWLTERFGWWQLQIGRVGAYVRRRHRR
jgi:uncharacterized membrane protein YjjP (DUF1212 family)